MCIETCRHYSRNQYQIDSPRRLNKMSDQCECPICMDVIDVTKNCVTTECGHKFHCSCLMQNAAHNGFGCPFCRTAMAEEPNEEDDEDQWSDVSDEDENEIYDDYALRGLRFMTNNLEGVAHDILDMHDENEDELEDTQETNNDLPSVTFIANKLAEQGITMEYLVKALLVEHEEYSDMTNSQNDEIDRANSEIFGKIRIIISNYTPSTENTDIPATPVAQRSSAPAAPLLTPSAPAAPLLTPSAPSRQQSSEPKTYATAVTPHRLVSEFMHDE